MTDEEVLQAMKDILKPINDKLDQINRKLGGTDGEPDSLIDQIDRITYESREAHQEIRQDLHKLTARLKAVSIDVPSRTPDGYHAD